MAGQARASESRQQALAERDGTSALFRRSWKSETLEVIVKVGQGSCWVGCNKRHDLICPIISHKCQISDDLIKSLSFFLSASCCHVAV